MPVTEWNLEDALRVCKEEARKAARRESCDLFSRLMNQAKSLDELRKMFEESFPGDT